MEFIQTKFDHLLCYQDKCIFRNLFLYSISIDNNIPIKIQMKIIKLKKYIKITSFPFQSTNNIQFAIGK